jgi:2-aminoadipate transaminase
MSLRGVECTERQVFLTAGAQQALNLLARVLLNQHDEVVVEELTYPGLHQVLEPYQPRVLTVPTDAQTGIDVDALEALLEGGARPAFVYVISNGHNPLGVEMAADKRRRLIDLAAQYRVPIIEDDPYGHLYYDDSPHAPLRALDDQWVLYVGSFSKILAPALRIGWAVVPEWVTDKLATVKEATDLNTTTFSQRAVSNYMDTGALPTHIARLRREYRSRRDAMLGALEECLSGEARWNEPRCGFFIWVELPPGTDAGRLLREAVETERVAFVPGFAFGVTGDRLGSNCLRLSFSNCPTKVIEEGVHRLARVLRTGGRAFAPAGGRAPVLAPTLS